MLFIYMLYTSVEHSTVFWPMLQLEFMQIYLLWKSSLYVHLRSHRVRQSKCQKLWLLKEPRTGLGCSLQCQQDVSYWLKHKVNEINGHCSPKKAKKQCRFFFFFFCQEATTCETFWIPHYQYSHKKHSLLVSLLPSILSSKLSTSKCWKNNIYN